MRKTLYFSENFPPKKTERQTLGLSWRRNTQFGRLSHELGWQHTFCAIFRVFPCRHANLTLSPPQRHFCAFRPRAWCFCSKSLLSMHSMVWCGGVFGRCQLPCTGVELPLPELPCPALFPANNDRIPCTSSLIPVKVASARPFRVSAVMISTTTVRGKKGLERGSRG